VSWSYVSGGIHIRLVNIPHCNWCGIFIYQSYVDTFSEGECFTHSQLGWKHTRGIFTSRRWRQYRESRERVERE
jgi:hypothetical protein